MFCIVSFPRYLAVGSACKKSPPDGTGTWHVYSRGDGCALSPVNPNASAECNTGILAINDILSDISDISVQ